MVVNLKCPNCESYRTYYIGGLLDNSLFKCIDCKQTFLWLERGEKPKSNRGRKKIK